MPAETEPNAPPAAACVLAFDTSTERLALGRARRRRLVHGDGRRRRAASATLLPRSHALLAQARLTLADARRHRLRPRPGRLHRAAHRLRGGAGPGLRAWRGRCCRSTACSSWPRTRARSGARRQPAFEVGVAMDARMDEVYAGRYRWQRRPLAGAAGAGAVRRLAALAEAWAGEPPQVLAGLGAGGLRASAWRCRRRARVSSPSSDRAARAAAPGAGARRERARASTPPRRCRSTCATRWR